MPEILKKIYLFKFTLIYSVGFFYLGGMVLGVPAFIGGLFVDIIMNKCRKNRKDSPTIIYWFIYLGLIAVLYPIIIFSAIDPDTRTGLIFTWINFTEPFTDAMASFIPAIDNYAKQIANFGGSWRVPKFRHLYAVFWFTNIVIAAPLLSASIIDLIYRYSLKETVLNFDRIIFKKLNPVILLFIILLGLVSFVMSDSYFGDELLRITYRKGHYLQWPFVLFSSIYGCILLFTVMCILNYKYLKYRRNNNA